VQRKKKWLALSLMLVLVLSLSVGCRHLKGSSEQNPEDEEPVPAGEEVKEQFFCPLDGVAVDDATKIERRPLAVMIGNIPGLAEPSGVDKACLVFEMLAEGGITRLMPIFLHQDATSVGSVRSARHYFLDKVLEFNAAYGHCGYSPQAKQDISKLKVISLNEFYLPQVYWRIRTKKEPHNVYTSTEHLFAELERRGLLRAPSPVQFSFYDENSQQQPLGAGCKKVTLHFSPDYTVGYVWDDVADGYARFVNGKPQKDEASGKQLVAKNVLVQFVDGTRVLDNEGRLDMKLVGQGSGRMFQQEITYELNWSKQSRAEPTKWTDKTGAGIRLVRGQSWIEILPRTTKVVWE
jgi:hypothetical protein